MSNNEVVSGEPITAAKANNITVGDTAPTNPQHGDIWVDTSISPPKIKVANQAGALQHANNWYGDSLILWLSLVVGGDGHGTFFFLEGEEKPTVFAANPDGDMPYGLLALAPHVRWDNGTIINGSNMALSDDSGAITLYPGVTYLLEWEASVSAGGASLNHIYVAFQRITGAGSFTLRGGNTIEFANNAAATIIQKKTSASLLGTQIEFQDALGDATSANNGTQYARGFAVFEVSAQGTYQMRFSEVAVGGSDPSFGNFMYKITPIQG